MVEHEPCHPEGLSLGTGKEILALLLNTGQSSWPGGSTQWYNMSLTIQKLRVQVYAMADKFCPLLLDTSQSNWPVAVAQW